jgi:hypothetical protein
LNLKKKMGKGSERFKERTLIRGVDKPKEELRHLSGGRTLVRGADKPKEELRHLSRGIPFFKGRKGDKTEEGLKAP